MAPGLPPTPNSFDEPTRGDGSAFVHFTDLYGNHLVLVELTDRA